MQVKTRAIVINYIKYSETSIICKIYTELLGPQSFMVNGVRSKSSKTKIALFQPLTQLDLVLNHRENKNLQRITEVKCRRPFKNIPANFYKSCIALFICEILQKIIDHQHRDEDFFNFLELSIDRLETSNKEQTLWIPLLFIVDLCRIQGFLPLELEGIQSQMFEANIETSKLTKEDQEAITQLITQGLSIGLDKKLRKKLFQYFYSYFRQTVGDLGDVKSLQVLREVMK